MAVAANSQGVVTGRFTIPANVSAGSKAVEFKGSGGSHGFASFFGQGTLVTNVMQSITKQTVRYYDPVAQTFYLDEMRQVVGVELFIVKKGTTPVTVHIRETSNGYPAQAIIAEAVLRPDQINAGQWSRWLFPMPTTLNPEVEYCVVVMCDDAETEIAIAEMGKWGIESQRWVTSQPPNVGVLFSSSNNSTWTAHQDRDMAMRLLAARYTQAERIIDLGTVAADGHTDGLLLATSEIPSSGTAMSVELGVPGAEAIDAGDGQQIAFLPAVTGNITLKAKLRATPKVSAMILPGSQLALGTVQPGAIYVSRVFDADAASSDIRVTFDARLPSGSNIKVYLADATSPPVWEEIDHSPERDPFPLGDGEYEFTYSKPGFNKARCRVKLELSGTNAARPRVRNLRVSVT